MHETFDHTADLGIRVRAADLDTLFAEAATALFSVLVEDLNTVHATIRIEVELTENDRELLLFDSDIEKNDYTTARFTRIVPSPIVALTSGRRSLLLRSIVTLPSTA